MTTLGELAAMASWAVTTGVALAVAGAPAAVLGLASAWQRRKREAGRD